jgi:hypothetical protein
MNLRQGLGITCAIIGFIFPIVIWRYLSTKDTIDFSQSVGNAIINFLFFAPAWLPVSTLTLLGAVYLWGDPKRFWLMWVVLGGALLIFGINRFINFAFSIP